MKTGIISARFCSSLLAWMKHLVVYFVQYNRSGPSTFTIHQSCFCNSRDGGGNLSQSGTMQGGYHQLLTSFNIHGLPLHVAKHPNRPKTTMTVPVPMSTQGALVELSAMSEMYGPSINLPHTPTASRIAPVICSRGRDEALFTNRY